MKYKPVTIKEKNIHLSVDTNSYLARRIIMRKKREREKDLEQRIDIVHGKFYNKK